ncbi:MAG: hypothetical protein H6962_00760 [Chromatiaceae bacterium]|nr:hypothetical protein [Chromatiaceae bacterium]
MGLANCWTPWVLGLLSLCLGTMLSGGVLGAGLPDIIDHVRPSVVAVGTFQPSGSPRQQFKGTGFVVGNGHLVVTNHHVVPSEIDEAKKEQLAVFSGPWAPGPRASGQGNC